MGETGRSTLIFTVFELVDCLLDQNISVVFFVQTLLGSAERLLDFVLDHLLSLWVVQTKHPVVQEADIETPTSFSLPRLLQIELDEFLSHFPVVLALVLINHVLAQFEVVHSVNSLLEALDYTLFCPKVELQIDFGLPESKMSPIVSEIDDSESSVTQLSCLFDSLERVRSCNSVFLLKLA